MRRTTALRFALIVFLAIGMVIPTGQAFAAQQSTQDPVIEAPDVPFVVDEVLVGEDRFFLVNTTETRIVAYNKSPVEEDWNETFEIDTVRDVIFNAEPDLDINAIYVGSRSGTSNEPGIEKINASNGSQVWTSSPAGDGRHNVEAVHTGDVFVADDGIGVDADDIWLMNRTDGSTEWKGQGLGLNNNFEGVTANADGSEVYVSHRAEEEDAGELTALDGNDGSFIDSEDNPEGASQRLVNPSRWVGGTVTIGADPNNLIQFDVSDASGDGIAVNWNESLAVVPSVDADEDRELIFSLEGDSVVARQLDGTVEWDVPTVGSNNTTGDPKTVGDGLVYATEANDVRVVGQVNGTVQGTWEFSPDDRIEWDANFGDLVIWSEQEGMFFEDVEVLARDFDDGTLELRTARYIKHGNSSDYTVTIVEDGSRTDVTGEASVTSDNTSVVTIDTGARKVRATSDTSVNDEANVTATLGDEQDTQRVVVANATMDNLEILPTEWRLAAMFSFDLGDKAETNFFFVMLAAMGGVVAGRVTGAFAGVGMVTVVIVIGWFADWVGTGVMLATLFAALFIGFNLAANIDTSLPSR